MVRALILEEQAQEKTSAARRGLFGAKGNSVVCSGRCLVVNGILHYHQVFPPPGLWFPLKSKLVVVMLATQFLSLPLVCQNLSCSPPLWWYPGSSGQDLNPTRALLSEGGEASWSTCGSPGLWQCVVWCWLGSLCRAVRGRGSSLADPATLFLVPHVLWNMLFSPGLAQAWPDRHRKLQLRRS